MGEGFLKSILLSVLICDCGVKFFSSSSIYHYGFGCVSMFITCITSSVIGRDEAETSPRQEFGDSNSSRRRLQPGFPFHQRQFQEAEEQKIGQILSESRFFRSGKATSRCEGAYFVFASYRLVYFIAIGIKPVFFLFFFSFW